MDVSSLARRSPGPGRGEGHPNAKPREGGRGTMRAVVQRVSEAWVRVEGATVSRSGAGLLVLLGVGREDVEADAALLADKVVNLRLFPDEGGHLNRSLLDVRGDVMVVSQFTLYGDCRK